MAKDIGEIVGYALVVVGLFCLGLALAGIALGLALALIAGGAGLIVAVNVQ